MAWNDTKNANSTVPYNEWNDMVAVIEFASDLVNFTELQEITGVGSTTIDWNVGYKVNFQFGSQNEEITFTDPTQPCNLLLLIKQDDVGSRTITWVNSILWSEGSEPFLSIGSANIDILSFYYDGTNYYGAGNFDFS